MKTSFWKSRPLALSAAGLVALGTGICPALAQTEEPQLDGRPGVDATPAELRAPAQQAESPPSPIPSTTAGAARPLGGEEEREMEQADPAQAQAAQTGLGTPTVFSVISASVDFTTLAGAVKAAGMEDDLSEGSAYTLFAPDNKAFEALPDGVLNVLLQPENQETLRDIISYHVVQGRLTSQDLRPRAFATLTGEQVTVAGAAEGKLTVQKANLTRVDVEAGNGVIHVIDEVLLPPGFSIDEFQPPEGSTVVIDEVTGEVQEVEIPDDAVLPE